MSPGLCDDEIVELAEMLELVCDWIERDRDTLNESLARFISSGGYSLDQLHTDLARFVFLLGGDAQRFINGDQP